MKFGDLTIQAQAEKLPKPYISFFSRDLSLGNGTQSVTGLGFKPAHIIFVAFRNVTDYASWGNDNTSQDNGVEHFGDTDNFASVSGGGYSIRISTSGTGFDIGGKATSMDTDGFTVTWTVLSGSPTGTASILFIASK